MSKVLDAASPAAAANTTVTTARPAGQEPSAQSLGNPSVWNFWSSSTNAG
jgi:hypothetical protein